VIEAVAAIAEELGTTSAAVARAWLRSRPGTVAPILGACRISHLEQTSPGSRSSSPPPNALRLDELSAPTLGHPAPLRGPLRAMLQFAGTTVDGEPSEVYPPLLRSDVRY
jgi:aryl-alcohol dehydrogenase (NADP+)